MAYKRPRYGYSSDSDFPLFASLAPLAGVGYGAYSAASGLYNMWGPRPAKLSSPYLGYPVRGRSQFGHSSTRYPLFYRHRVSRSVKYVRPRRVRKFK